MFNIGDYVKIKNSNFIGKIINVKIRKNETIFCTNINNKNLLVSSDKLEKVDKISNISKINTPNHCNRNYEITFPSFTVAN